MCATATELYVRMMSSRPVCGRSKALYDRYGLYGRFYRHSIEYEYEYNSILLVLLVRVVALLIVGSVCVEPSWT